MFRILYAVLAGLVGAGIVHIALLFALPSLANRDAWTRLAERAAPYVPVRFDAEADDPAVSMPMDPSIRAIACRFDLSQGLVHVEGDGSVPFWSASVYDRAGNNIDSISDSATPDHGLDFEITTPEQMSVLQSSPPEDFGESTFIVAPISEGIVVVRALVPDASWEPTVKAFVDGARCSLR